MNKKRILLVDDDITLVDMYKERLAVAGYDVIVAHSGEEALKSVGEVKPDIVLLDIMMPKVNGFDVLHSLKGDPKTKDIPVIILTALIQDTNKAKGMEAGADDYIIKSETMPGEVLQKVEAIFAKGAKK